jgi:hypothetical protein
MSEAKPTNHELLVETLTEIGLPSSVAEAIGDELRSLGYRPTALQVCEIVERHGLPPDGVRLIGVCLILAQVTKAIELRVAAKRGS